MILQFVRFNRGDKVVWKKGGPPHWTRECERLARMHGEGPFEVYAISTKNHQQFLVLSGLNGPLMTHKGKNYELISALLVEKEP